MRLSEAIRLGSLTIENPEAGNIDACAITMALNAAGRREETQWLNYPAVEYEWPWLNTYVTGKSCPWCAGKFVYGPAVLYHTFDNHVMPGQITIEQLADWIASIEPAEHKPISSEEMDRGLALTRCHGE